MDKEQLKRTLEALIMASSTPLNLDRMLAVFPEDQQPSKEQLCEALAVLAEDFANTSLELKEVSTGYRFQVRKDYAEWAGKLWEEKPARYSRALLETLALVAYKQPITRGEIEKIRGVSVNTQIMKTLLEREWVTIVGHRDVPGKPAIYATTRQFLDYFNLKSLEDLPPLAEIRDLDQLNGELAFSEAEGELTAEANMTDENEAEEEAAAEANKADENEAEGEAAAEANKMDENEAEGEAAAEANKMDETDAEGEQASEASKADEEKKTVVNLEVEEGKDGSDPSMAQAMTAEH